MGAHAAAGWSLLPALVAARCCSWLVRSGWLGRRFHRRVNRRAGRRRRRVGVARRSSSALVVNGSAEPGRRPSATASFADRGRRRRRRASPANDAKSNESLHPDRPRVRAGLRGRLAGVGRRDRRPGRSRDPTPTDLAGRRGRPTRPQHQEIRDARRRRAAGTRRSPLATSTRGRARQRRRSPPSTSSSRTPLSRAGADDHRARLDQTAAPCCSSLAGARGPAPALVAAGLAASGRRPAARGVPMSRRTSHRPPAVAAGACWSLGACWRPAGVADTPRARRQPGAHRTSPAAPAPGARRTCDRTACSPTRPPTRNPLATCRPARRWPRSSKRGRLIAGVSADTYLLGARNPVTRPDRGLRHRHGQADREGDLRRRRTRSSCG